MKIHLKVVGLYKVQWELLKLKQTNKQTKLKRQPKFANTENELGDPQPFVDSASLGKWKLEKREGPEAASISSLTHLFEIFTRMLLYF